ncbi:315_t:CDS:2 [Paraglomus brasilianum]|uniref:315_t:CDS:1 n=1 Tax=Paraglomus brasilianum TaxID=144538 RepID=A0A9N9FQA3_9GLOM|nr:315_t:CDS:2 [Paraglomus brasilianum]
MSQRQVFVSGTFYLPARAVVRELYKRLGRTVSKVRLGIHIGQMPLDLARGGKICLIDPTDIENVRNALEGVDAAFLWQAPNEPDHLLRDFIDVAEEMGVKNLVVLSSYHSHPNSGQEIEEYISSKSIAQYTFLRVPFFTHHFDIYKNTIINEKILPLPIGTEGSFAPLDDRDFAEVVATLLVSPNDNPHHQAAYTLTGPRLYTGPELAVRLSVIINDHVTFLGTSLNEADRYLSNILPQEDEQSKQRHLELYRAIRDSECQVKTEDVTRILGDEKVPRDIEIYFGDIIVKIIRGY